MKRDALKEAGYEDGIHVWSLGYRDQWAYMATPAITSDEADNDDYDEEDEEDAMKNQELIDRMRSDDINVSENFTVEELEQMQYSM